MSRQPFWGPINLNLTCHGSVPGVQKAAEEMILLLKSEETATPNKTGLTNDVRVTVKNGVYCKYLGVGTCKGNCRRFLVLVTDSLNEGHTTTGVDEGWGVKLDRG